jgi:hypothetical protein
MPISILLLLALVTVAVTVTTATPSVGVPNGTTSGPIECLLLLRGTHFEDRTTLHEWTCSFDGGYPVLVVGTGAAGDKNEDIKTYLDAHGAKSGKTMMVLSKANFATKKASEGEGRLVVAVEQVLGLEDNDNDNDNDSRLSTEKRNSNRQGLPQPRGTLDTLVLRVNSLDYNAPAAIALSEDIFNDPVCLKSQFATCSYNEMQIQEYIPGNGISNVPTVANAPGVVEVNLNKNVDGESPYNNAFSAYYQAATLFGVTSLSSLFDLVLVCMPPGMGSWVAYAYIGWNLSVYNNDWCQMVSAQMHEVGHNIGLHHSGEYWYGGSYFAEYADQTGYMGYAYKTDDTPAMCFNPAHNWQLGWYSDKRLEINPEDDLCESDYPTSYIVNGIVDYGDTTDGANVILKIGNFFVGYNKATGFNEGTAEAKNQVTVTKKRGTPTSSDLTELLGILSVGDTFYIEISDSLQVGVRYSQNTNNKDAVVELFVEGGDVSYHCSAVPSATPSGSASPSESFVASSSPTVSPTPLVCDSDEVDFQIELQTDWFGNDTSIATFSLDDDYTDLDDLMHFGHRSSFESMTLYDIPMCLERDRCYVFAIRDSYGDGLSEDNGYVRLYQDGKRIFQSGGDFGFYDSRIFCTGDHVCRDNEEIVFTKNDLSCDEFVRGKKKTRKKRCNKFIKGDFVRNHCPETCGRKAKKGPCKWMRDKEAKMKQLVKDEMNQQQEEEEPQRK